MRSRRVHAGCNVLVRHEKRRLLTTVCVEDTLKHEGACKLVRIFLLQSKVGCER